MTEEPFSTRELREMFSDIKNDLTEVKGQTSKTNGRVSKLENWMWFIRGAIAVLVVIIVPILAWSLYVLVNIQTTVHSAVDQALSAYNIKQVP